MNYTINIDQKAIHESGLDIDIKDAIIIDFIKTMPGSVKIEKKLIDNDLYFWVSYQYIIDQNPLLGIKSKDGVYRRILKLISMDLLKAHGDNQKSNKSFYSLTQKFEDLFVGKDDRKASVKNKKPKGTYGLKSEGPTDEKSEVPTDEKSDNSFTIYSYTNDTLNNNGEKEFSPDSGQQDLFGVESKTTVFKSSQKQAKKSSAHPAHVMLKKFWFEEFKPGSNFEKGSGAFINKIIDNIEKFLTTRGSSCDAQNILDFFKILCYESRKSTNTYYSLFGLKNFQSATDFDKIVELIEKNGHIKTNNYGKSRIDNANKSRSVIDQLYNQSNINS